MLKDLFKDKIKGRMTSVLTFKLAPDLAQRLEDLVQKSGDGSLVQTFKMALTLYEKAIDNRIAGGELHMVRMVDGERVLTIIEL
jgi:hypothetical protein